MKVLKYLGQKHTIEQWAMITHIDKGTIRSRLAKGYSVEQALTTPVVKAKLIEFNGQEKSLKDWAIEFGLSRDTLYDRYITRKIPFAQAISSERIQTKVPSVLKNTSRADKIRSGIESWQDVMYRYFTKEHRIKCYKKLKSDYEDIKREAMTRAA